MKTKSHSVQSRLKKWGHWVQDRQHLSAASYSPFGKIADERNASGNHGDGIRYEVIDGVSCPPDGGLSRELERHARAWGHDIRCREVHQAVASLPPGMRRAIVETYVVSAREDPRSAREVARRLDLHLKTVQESLHAAYRHIEREIFGPFELAEFGHNKAA